MNHSDQPGLWPAAISRSACQPFRLSLGRPDFASAPPSRPTRRCCTNWSASWPITRAWRTNATSRSRPPSNTCSARAAWPMPSSPSSSGQPAGFAVYYRTLSTFVARPGLYLEDLFVRPAFPPPGHRQRACCTKSDASPTAPAAGASSGSRSSGTKRPARSIAPRRPRNGRVAAAAHGRRGPGEIRLRRPRRAAMKTGDRESDMKTDAAGQTTPELILHVYIHNSTFAAMSLAIEILPARAASIAVAGTAERRGRMRPDSLAGSVSQRACVFCGSRVVLYPIADALHLVHGPIGCAAYTWDIRGAQSSGPQLHPQQLLHRPAGAGRHLRRREETRSAPCSNSSPAINRRPPSSTPPASSASSATTSVRSANASPRDTGIPVLSGRQRRFKGTKKDGYRAACEAVYTLIGTGDTAGIRPLSINCSAISTSPARPGSSATTSSAWASRWSPPSPATAAWTTSAAATARSSILCNAPAR